jgi:hypothetical protein
MATLSHSIALNDPYMVNRPFKARALIGGKGGGRQILCLGTWITSYADFVRRVGFPMMRPRRKSVGRFRLVARGKMRSLA